MTMKTAATHVILTFLSLIVAISAVSEGDPCGINGGDFLDDSFGGTNAVSGPGCTLADGSTDCYCASIKGDENPFGEWVWQCNTPEETKVEFGPREGKECPAAIPVPKDYDFAQPLCDTSIHPTGLAGDPSCPYHDCDEGGDMSAVCGCVDMAAYQMGEGMAWYCLHSTCSSDDGFCGTVNGGGEQDSSSGSYVHGNAVSIVSALAIVVGFLFV